MTEQQLLPDVAERVREIRDSTGLSEVQATTIAIQELERVLGTKVRIVEKGKKKGKIEIDYYSPDDLDRIYSAICGAN